MRAELRRLGVVLLKADWTSRDPQITEALAAFNRSAVPLDLVYLPGRAEPLILPELLTPDIVSAALRQAAEKIPSGAGGLNSIPARLHSTPVWGTR